ncbi:MAG: hypothetical protein ACLGIR_11055 [Actinomycetes bacterium]
MVGPQRPSRRFRPATFAPPVAARLRAGLALAHASEPFTPSDPRGAAGRVARLAEALGLDVVTVRGGLDVGGAELDHVWVAVEGRVVDPTVVAGSSRFVAALRAYVAGDLDADDLDFLAHGHPIERRVLGAFPDTLGYVGAPVWSSRPPALRVGG